MAPISQEAVLIASVALVPVKRIAAAASGWGLNPDKDAVYLNVFPEKNDGKTPYRLTVD